MSVRIPREKVSADKWAVSHSSDEAKRAKKRARQGVLSRTTSTVVEGTKPPHVSGSWWWPGHPCPRCEVLQG